MEFKTDVSKRDLINSKDYAALWLLVEILSIQEKYSKSNSVKIADDTVNYIDSLSVAFVSALGTAIDNMDDFVKMLVDGVHSLTAVSYTIGYESALKDIEKDKPNAS